MPQGVKQRFHEPVGNDIGDIFIDFCAQDNLRINYTLFDHNTLFGIRA